MSHIHVLVFDEDSEWVIDELIKRFPIIDPEDGLARLDRRLQAAKGSTHTGSCCALIRTVNGVVKGTGWNATWKGPENTADWYRFDKQFIYDFRNKPDSVRSVLIISLINIFKGFKGDIKQRPRLPPNPPRLTQPLPLP